MSVLNLNGPRNIHAKLQETKKVSSENADIKKEIENIKAMIQPSKDNEIRELRKQIDALQELLNRSNERLEKFSAEFATKSELMTVSDDITVCLEDYVLNATPRNVTSTIDLKICELETRLNELANAQVTRSAQDVEICEVVEEAVVGHQPPNVPKIIFKKPEKKRI